MAEYKVIYYQATSFRHAERSGKKIDEGPIDVQKMVSHLSATEDMRPNITITIQQPEASIDDIDDEFGSVKTQFVDIRTRGNFSRNKKFRPTGGYDIKLLGTNFSPEAIAVENLKAEDPQTAVKYALILITHL